MHDPREVFGAAADAYAASRPGYPAATVDWLLEGLAAPVHAVDVGAGTGLLTAALVSRLDAVTAVEPSDGMRAVLTRDLPGITALGGTAEAMPLADAAADVVTAAQAWHWVDPTRASAECARVLRPGGRLALVWNLRDEDDPWVARLGRALDGRDAAGWADDIRAGRPRVEAPFGPLEHHVERWEQPMDVDRLVHLAASRSYVIERPEPERRRTLDAVRALGEETAQDGLVRVPYVTHAFRTSTPTG